MSIFSRKDPVTPEPAGVTALRRKVIACASKPSVLHAVARDVPNLGIDALQDFASNKAGLKPEILQALAKQMFDARLNDDGLLEPLNKPEIKPMCASGSPPFVDPKSHPFYTPPRDPGAPLLAPQPVKPETPKVKTSRPGWLGGWT
jgi:hypothetical protein